MQIHCLETRSLSESFQKSQCWQGPILPSGSGKEPVSLLCHAHTLWLMVPSSCPSLTCYTSFGHIFCSSQLLRILLITVDLGNPC